MFISLNKKHVRCAVVVALLAAASGVANAQSAEYRRGYDQGYHDGMEAQNHREHEGAGRIVIEEARYGRRDGGSCNPRDVIQQAIGGRRHFDINVNNDLCGDPAPHEPKHLHIRYRCGDSQSVEAEAPGGSVLALSCQ
jgi:hypothetical protein